MFDFTPFADWQAHLHAVWAACQSTASIILLTVAGVLALYLWARLAQRQRFIRIFESTTGKVRIHEGALTSLIQSACKAYPVAGKPRIHFKIKGSQIHLAVRLKLTLTQPAATAAEGLQSHISTVLKDNLGESLVGNIDILITGFKGNPSLSAAHLAPLLQSLEDEQPTDNPKN